MLGHATGNRAANAKMGLAKMGTAWAVLLFAALYAAVLISSGTGVRAGEDERELVTLPPMMQAHMLANMRDHLRALEDMLGELAAGNSDKAAQIAEKRLGMSSLTTHGAAHLGKYMPQAMRALGTQMHHAASRFVIVVRNAELESGKAAQREVYKALQGIVENCNACHSSYRIR